MSIKIEAASCSFTTEDSLVELYSNSRALWKLNYLWVDGPALMPHSGTRHGTPSIIWKHRKLRRSAPAFIGCLGMLLTAQLPQSTTNVCVCFSWGGGLSSNYASQHTQSEQRTTENFTVLTVLTRLSGFSSALTKRRNLSLMLGKKSLAAEDELNKSEAEAGSEHAPLVLDEAWLYGRLWETRALHCKPGFSPIQVTSG